MLAAKRASLLRQKSFVASASEFLFVSPSPQTITSSTSTKFLPGKTFQTFPGNFGSTTRNDLAYSLRMFPKTFSKIMNYLGYSFLMSQALQSFTENVSSLARNYLAYSFLMSKQNKNVQKIVDL